MRGRVLSYDGAAQTGFIVGESGVRYSFAKADLRRLTTLDEGTVVEFHPEEDRAREIFVVRERQVAAPARFGRFAETDHATAQATGLWDLSVRCLTGNFANFRDRARRKEYWGFFLFYVIGLTLVLVAGFVGDAAMDTLDDPVLTIALPVVYVVALFVPSLALTIRRLHDIGLSGWFYLLVFVPSVGGLIILVMALIPSQRHDNKWGPAPQGIEA